MMGRFSRCCLLATGVAAVLVCGTLSPTAQERRADPPVDSGLVETTGLSLMLLDVEVLDEDGRPVPGLTENDFTVRLNGKRWPIYSLDDLCPTPEQPSAEEAVVATRTLTERDDASSQNESAAGSSSSPQSATSAGHPPPVSDRLRYALYFDFSRLAIDGRNLATQQARRWVRETMQPADEAMVAAYSTRAGLKEIAAFTNDKTVLLEAIDVAFNDVELRDPYSNELFTRIEQCCQRCGELGVPPICCNQCCPSGGAFCRNYGWEEFRQSRYSLKALQRLLSGLAEQPGRKAVLFFQQNLSSKPQMMLGSDTLDHLQLIEEIGADATQARATLSTAFAGDIRVTQPWVQDWAVNLGANFADFTGGSYNRALNDLSAMVDSVGRAPNCIYRIGLEPPDPTKGSMYTAKIALRDRLLPFRYRIQHLTESDKWWRKTLDVLDDPRQARDVRLVAAVVPTRASRGRWDVNVQVALDIESLELLERGDKQSGQWEVGALLIRDRGYGKKWEMLAEASLARKGEGESEVVVLHERELTGLEPGTYEIRAFARDKWSDRYGGGSGQLVLPKPGKMALAGPVVMRAGALRVVSTLPLRQADSVAEVRTDRIESGPVPLGRRDAAGGEPLEFRT
jgi:VWFA-related protein